MTSWRNGVRLVLWSELACWSARDDGGGTAAMPTQGRAGSSGLTGGDRALVE